MASAFAAGTIQNALGSVIGGVAGNSGTTFLEKRTIPGLSNSAADYRTRGINLFEAYGHMLSDDEQHNIRMELGDAAVALEEVEKDFPWYLSVAGRWLASRTAKRQNKTAFKLVRKLSEKARLDNPNIQPKSDTGSRPSLTLTSTTAAQSPAAGQVTSAIAETIDPFRDPSLLPVLNLRAATDSEETEGPTWTLVSPDRKRAIRFLLPEDVGVDKDMTFIYCDHPPVSSDNDDQGVPSSPALSGSFDDDVSAPDPSIRLTTISH